MIGKKSSKYLQNLEDSKDFLNASAEFNSQGSNLSKCSKPRVAPPKLANSQKLLEHRIDTAQSRSKAMPILKSSKNLKNHSSKGSSNSWQNSKQQL
jgi:hypothetical protein